MWTRPMSARSCSRSTSVARSRPGSPRRATASTTSPSITTTSICPRNRRAAMVAEPERFNACEYLLDRRVKAGDGGRLAITGAGGQFSYAQLLDLVQRTAAGLRETGLEPEQRIVMFCSDGPAFAAVYLAAMRIGAIPVPVSTMLRAAGLAELLRDSRARLLAVTPEFGELAAEAAAAAPELRGILASGGTGPAAATVPVHDLDALVAAAVPDEAVYLSAAKAFFAYGLGNSLLFPLSAGAAAILEPAPARPQVVAERAAQFGATLFFAGPTFFANMLRAE